MGRAGREQAEEAHGAGDACTALLKREDIQWQRM